MAMVRGNAMASGIAHIKKTYGEDVFGKIVAAMQPGNARILGAGVARNSWYPFDAYMDFCACGDRLLGKGDYSHARETASNAAEADLSIVLKFFVTVFSSPSDLLQKLPTMWGSYYDSGELVVTLDGPSQIRVELRNFPTPHALQCALLAGWLERFMQLAIRRKSRVASCTHPRCRAAGAATCEFVVDFT